MKRVLIAGDIVKGRLGIPCSYVDALRTVDALGAIAYARDEGDAQALAEGFDALILPGGGDLPAEMFAQEPHVSLSLDEPARDLSDRLLMEAFLKRQKRVLGICRGCQGANVFLGGTLHQHLPDHYDPVLWHSGNITGRHAVQVAENTLLGSLIGTGETKINSSHHQAIDALGKGLSLAAIAPDGVIEAVEGENLLLLQWHPERMGDVMRPVFEWVIGER